MSKTVSFSLALNSSAEDVAEVVDSIYAFFGFENTAGGVEPSAIVNGTLAPAAVNNVVANVIAAGGEVDSSGMPWDERIHSSSKEKNADGKWRYRRNLSPAIKTRIEAEIRASLSASPAAAVANVGAAAPQLSLPAVNTAAPGLPALPGANIENPAFTAFVSFITANTTSPANPAGRLTADWVKQSLAAFGVANGDIQNLAHAPHLIPQIEGAIKHALGIA